MANQANTTVRRALISVSDKTGIVEFGRALTDRGIELLSIGGTFRMLKENQVPVTEVSDHTGFPEMMDGRVKTLEKRFSVPLIEPITPRTRRARFSCPGFFVMEEGFLPMPVRLLLLMSLLPVLAACAGMKAPPPRDEAPLPPRVTTDADSCGAARVQDRVGRHFADPLGDSMLAESGAAALRVMEPGQAYTMEYRADRLNIRLDEDGVITTIGCG